MTGSSEQPGWPTTMILPGSARQGSVRIRANDSRNKGIPLGAGWFRSLRRNRRDLTRGDKRGRQGQPAQRIDRSAVDNDLKVKMWTVGATRRACRADELPLLDKLPRLDVELREVGVLGKDAMTMIDDDHIAAHVVELRHSDAPTRRRIDRLTKRTAEIHASVVGVEHPAVIGAIAAEARSHHAAGNGQAERPIPGRQGGTGTIDG